VREPDPEIRSAELAAEERSRIVGALSRELGERGSLGAVSLERVMREANVGDGAFERHFGSVEEAMLAAQDAFLDKLLLEAASGCGGPDWPTSVRDAIDSMLAYVAEASTLARVLAFEVSGMSMAAQERRFSRLNGLAELLRDGRRLYPRTAKMPASMEPTLVGGIASIVSGRLLAEDTQGFDQLSTELADAVLSFYLGPEMV
jgi:AcrR family transcriptional regulator